MIPAKYSHLANGVRVVYDLDADSVLRVSDYMVRDYGTIERCAQLAHNEADDLRDAARQRKEDPERIRVTLVYPAFVFGMV